MNRHRENSGGEGPGRSVTGVLPVDIGFRMPAEFETHAQSWLLWPERTDVWPFGAKKAQATFAELAHLILQFEPVTVGVSIRQYENARSRLSPEVRVVELTYNGCWIRDSGPVFVTNSNNCVRAVHWGFNAWGGLSEGLYFPWDLDATLPERLLDIEGIRRWVAPYVLEGGAVHVDGQGTLIATRDCVLNLNRNPKGSAGKVEKALKNYLGVDRVIWVPVGLNDDETGGHVDNLCFFARPGEVVLAWTDDPKHPQFDVVRQAWGVLNQTTDAQGRQLKLHKIPFPKPQTVTAAESESIDHVRGTVPRPSGMQLPASYANCYFVNGGLIVPTFSDSADEEAVCILTELFPDRQVVGFPSRDILIGGGNIHCNVLQQPTGLKEYSTQEI